MSDLGPLNQGLVICWGPFLAHSVHTMTFPLGWVAQSTCRTGSARAAFWSLYWCTVIMRIVHDSAGSIEANSTGSIRSILTVQYFCGAHLYSNTHTLARGFQLAQIWCNFELYSLSDYLNHSKFAPLNLCRPYINSFHQAGKIFNRHSSMMKSFRLFEPP